MQCISCHVPIGQRACRRHSPSEQLLDLLPHLKLIELPRGKMIFAAGDSIEAVYFPHDGLVSLVIGLSTGEMIEVGMIGRNSLVGVSSAFGNKIALSRAVAQTTGRGSVLHVDRFCDLAERSTAFRAILARVIGKLGVRPSVRVWESLYILFDERDR